MVWNKCVKINKMRNALSNVLQSTCDDKAAIRKAYQNDIVEILVQYVIDHIADVRAEADHWTGKMYPFTNSGQARR